MKMVKRRRSKLQEQDQTFSDKDDDQNQLHKHSTTQGTFQSKSREAHQPKWLNYKHFGLVSSSNFASKQDYQDLGRRVLRSTGRKDRHSKICTAKGPRDRRVRLAANTAIQFYDVQDRLGYDRPSEAIEWLMKEAKVAIDDLQTLPQETEHQTEFEFSNEKEDPFMGLLVPSPSSDLHYLLHNTISTKPRSENQAFGHNPVQFSLFSGSNSLDSEETFTNWPLPQTLELRNGELREGSFDVGSASPWLQAVSGGTLQSSYYHPSSFPVSMNAPHGTLDSALGPCLATTNWCTNGGFSGFGSSLQVQGEEEEKQNTFPNKPSSGSFLLNFQD